MFYNKRLCFVIFKAFDFATVKYQNKPLIKHDKKKPNKTQLNQKEFDYIQPKTPTNFPANKSREGILRTNSVSKGIS